MWQGKYSFTVNQWGVGKGGFHSQTLIFQPLLRNPTRHLYGDSTIRVVYDCGSGQRATPRRALKNEVDRMVYGLPEDSSIDLLAISHFDFDHVNGLDMLSSALQNKGVTVKRVWAPVLTKLEALYALATSGLTASARDSFAEILNDPARHFSNLFDRAEVTLLRPDEVPIPPAPAFGEANVASDDRMHVISSASGRGLNVYAETEARQEALWEFQPYVIESALVGANAVSQLVASALGKPVNSCSIQDLIKLAGDKALLTAFHAAVNAHHRNLTTQPSSARTGANLSTLCLYSGPVSPYEWCAFRGGWNDADSDPRPIPFAPSWLGTADAGLRKQQHIDSLQSVLGPNRLDRVGISNAPHHGSKHDSSALLWDSLPNVRVITIEADKVVGGAGNNHPHKEVLSELQRRNQRFHITVPGNAFSHTRRGIR